MNTLKTASLAVAVFCISAPLQAAPLYYDCKIENAYGLDSDNALQPVSSDHELIGSKFHVTRLTGEISGKLVHTRGATKFRVIHRGTEEAPFKSIAEYTGHVQLLVIDESAEGDVKPFVVNTSEGLSIASGSCK